MGEAIRWTFASELFRVSLAVNRGEARPMTCRSVLRSR